MGFSINFVTKLFLLQTTWPYCDLVRNEVMINLLLIDSKGSPSKIGKRINKKTGKKERYFKTTGDLAK